MTIFKSSDKQQTVYQMKVVVIEENGVLACNTMIFSLG